MDWALGQHLVITACVVVAVSLVCLLRFLTPAVRHALWLIVLIRFLAPAPFAWLWAVSIPVNGPPAVAAISPTAPPDLSPVSALPTLHPSNPSIIANAAPSMSSSPPLTPAIDAALPPAASPTDLPAAPSAPVSIASRAAANPLTPLALLFTLWLAGSILFCALQVTRILRMRRRLRGALPAGAALEHEVRRLAASLGIHPPPVKIVPGMLSPVIWSCPHPVLLWPDGPSTSGLSTESIILHELAHIVRRDHWTGFLELFAGCLWWWNPFFWHARRQLRQQAELACDAWVVHLRPNLRRKYASSLLTLCESFQSRDRGSERFPALGIRTRSRHALERRFALIMQHSPRPRITWPVAVALVAVALATWPAWAQQVPSHSATVSIRAIAAPQPDAAARAPAPADAPPALSPIPAIAAQSQIPPILLAANIPTSPAAAAIAAPSGKFPIPDAATLKTAVQLVQDVYKDDLAAAKTPEQKLAVAQKMLDAVKDEKDSAGIYALTTKALNLACEAADLQSALVVADNLNLIFTIDDLQLKTDSAAYVAQIITTPEQRKNFITVAAPLVDAALDADRYDLAKSTSQLIVAAARDTKDAPLLSEADARLQRVVDAQQTFDDANKALAVLAQKPNDPDANLKAGTYRCLIKGDWEDGLPMLALSSDDTLKSLAKAEIAGITTVDGQIKLADGWWDLAEKSTGPAKTNLQAHAAQWYQAAIPNLTGLAKMKVAQRLAESPNGNPPAQVASAAPATISVLDNLVPSPEVVVQKTDEGLVFNVKTRKEGELVSEKKFQTPLVITAVAKTNSTNIRLMFGDKGRITFNWEMNQKELRHVDPKSGEASGLADKGSVPKNTWVTIRWIIDEKQSRVQVDGVDRAVFAGDYSGLTGAVGIGTNYGATITAKSLDVLSDVTKPSNATTDGLEIVEAKWGVGDRQADVAGKLRSMVQEGALQFTANGKTLGDPAFGQYKELALVYQIRSEKATLHLTHDSQVTISKLATANPSVAMRIVEARCVVGAQQFDVTKKLQEMAKTDSLEFTANSESFPSLAPNGKLVLTYEIYGTQVVLSMNDGSQLSIVHAASSGTAVVASSAPPFTTGLRVPTSLLRPYVVPPVQPPAPFQPPGTAPQTPGIPAPRAAPTGPNAIERPQFASAPKPIVKNITSISAMMVHIADDGDAIGLTSDIIASVDPETRNARDGSAQFLRGNVGQDMKTSFEEAIRAVKMRYPTWSGGRIDFSFGEKYSEHDGGSAGTAFGVLLLSSLEGFDIDPKCAVTGDITVDWKVRKVGGVTAKLHGATLDKCLYAAIPQDNETAFADMALLYGDSALWNIQVFSIATLQDAENLARIDRPAKLAEAIRLFADLQPQLTKAGKQTLQNPDTQKMLQHILDLAPNHLSAKYLLAIAQGKASKTLSANATLYRLEVILHPYQILVASRQKINRESLPISVTINARKELNLLRPIADKAIFPLLTDESAFIESLEDYAASASRYSADTLATRAKALDARFDELANDKELRGRLMREGY